MSTFALPHRSELVSTLRRNQIDFAALFGSRAKGTARADSDYDLLIEFSPEKRVGIFKYQEIESEIESVLGNKVDLVTVGGLDKYIKDEVFSTMKVIYDNRSKK